MDRVLPALPDLELTGRYDPHELVLDLDYPEQATRLPIDGCGKSLPRVPGGDLEVQDQIVVHCDKILTS